MLEFLLLYFLCKKMGELLRAKGWARTVWVQVLVVLAWFGCMLAGSLGYGVYIVLTQGEAAIDDVGFEVYPIALVSAGIGVGIVFLIARMLPARVPPPLITEAG